MYGAILGDMIGAPYEFDRGNKTKDFPLFVQESRFTDDTVMTAAVAEALLEHPGASDEAIRTALAVSMQKWGHRYPCAGYGRRFWGWLRAKIDRTTLLMCLRILRMGMGGVGAAFLEESLLPGGNLEHGFFIEAYGGGESRLWEALQPTAYCKLAAVEGDPRPLSAVEKAADDLYMDRVRADARIPFGASIAGGYLVGCETAVKNIRIILAAKDAGLDAAALRERIRVSYV